MYVILNRQPTKNNVVWRTLVNVDNVKRAVQKLKKINWIYKDTDVDSVNNAAKQVIEVANSATSTMISKATDDDVAHFQSYTIRNLDNKCTTDSDIEQYKMMNVKEDALSNQQAYLDVMCFPTLFPTGEFGEHHPRTAKISPSEYVKSQLMNKDSRFRKCPEYIFYLLWQKEMREI